MFSFISPTTGQLTVNLHQRQCACCEQPGLDCTCATDNCCTRSDDDCTSCGQNVLFCTCFGTPARTHTIQGAVCGHATSSPIDTHYCSIYCSDQDMDAGLHERVFIDNAPVRTRCQSCSNLTDTPGVSLCNPCLNARIEEAFETRTEDAACDCHLCTPTAEEIMCPVCDQPVGDCRCEYDAAHAIAEALTAASDFIVNQYFNEQALVEQRADYLRTRLAPPPCNARIYEVGCPGGEVERDTDSDNTCYCGDPRCAIPFDGGTYPPHTPTPVLGKPTTSDDEEDLPF